MKFQTLAFIILIPLYSFAQIGLTAKYNTNFYKNINYFLDDDGNVVGEPPYKQVAHSLNLGVNYQIELGKSLVIELEENLGYFSRSMSQRHRFPDDPTIHENIRFRNLYLDSRIGIGLSFSRMILISGYSFQKALKRNLVSDEAKYRFDNNRYKNFYKNNHALYLKLSYNINEKLEANLGGEIFLNEQLKLYPKSIDRYVDGQLRISFGFTYRLK